jgi:hypothetical protein
MAQQLLDGNRFLNRHQNSKGQVLIEFVLLGVVAIGMLSLSVKIFRDKKIVQSITQGPWEKTSGMIESGVWAAPADARKNHPNSTTAGRQLSVDPK